MAENVRVRILFTFTGGAGHFLPLTPIAAAAAARGHEVAFSGQEMMRATVEAAGFTAYDSGGRTLTDAHKRMPLVPVDRAAEAAVIRNTFAGTVARERAGRLLAVAGQWRPDVIVRDEMDFGAAAVAERLGLPHAAVIVLAAGGMVGPGDLAEPLAALRGEHGLAPDPAMAHRYLTLAPFPRSFRDPADALPASTVHIRPGVLEAPAAAGAARAGGAAGGRATVYFTLGTIFHQESGDLFTRVLAGLRELDADIVVTLGREIDPAEVGPQPAHVRVERFIPQRDLLPHCALAVTHAGSGSVIGALAFGVPLLLLPMGADQPHNADRCAALGVGRQLDPLTAGPAEIRAAAAGVLATPAYREAAGRLRAETAALPPADHAVDLIAGLRAARVSTGDAPQRTDT
jgi:UDP:flavonoid glycosyltransferase YjiC (YdhE family)